MLREASALLDAVSLVKMPGIWILDAVTSTPSTAVVPRSGDFSSLHRRCTVSDVHRVVVVQPLPGLDSCPIMPFKFQPFPPKLAQQKLITSPTYPSSSAYSLWNIIICSVFTPDDSFSHLELQFARSSGTALSSIQFHASQGSGGTPTPEKEIYLGICPIYKL